MLLENDPHFIYIVMTNVRKLLLAKKWIQYFLHKSKLKKLFSRLKYSIQKRRRSKRLKILEQEFNVIRSNGLQNKAKFQLESVAIHHKPLLFLFVRKSTEFNGMEEIAQSLREAQRRGNLKYNPHAKKDASI
jgi:predicted acylesterase/phospholipase RssA